MKTIDAFTLTPKQQRFCDEYLIDMNATRAALRAGYTQATAMNGQLMEMPKIQAYLKERTAQAAQKLQVSHETLLGELMKVAFANMGDYFGDDGKIKPMQDIVDDKKSAIWSLKVSEGKYGTTVQLRLHNKLAALEKIAKHIKFYEAEPKKPAEEAVYVDKEDLNEDDRFEDDSIDALDKADSERKERLDAFEMRLNTRDRNLQKREERLKELGVVVGGNLEPDNTDIGEPSRERKLPWSETFAIVYGIACRNEAELKEVTRKEEARMRAEMGVEDNANNGVATVVGDNTNNGAGDNTNNGSSFAEASAGETGKTVDEVPANTPKGPHRPVITKRRVGMFDITSYDAPWAKK